MARGKKPLLENIEIKKIAAEGKSIAYVDEKVLFVPNTVPGNVKVSWKALLLTYGNTPTFVRNPFVRTSEYVADANGKTCLINYKPSSNNRKSSTTCKESVR